MFRKTLVPIVAIMCGMGWMLLGVADDEHAGNIEIRELRSEKVKILEDLVTRYEFAFSKGKPVLEELIEAKHAVLQAKLPMADSRANRVRLLEAIVENRESLVEARIAGQKLGSNAEVDILTARVELIDAKIAMRHASSER